MYLVDFPKGAIAQFTLEFPELLWVGVNLDIAECLPAFRGTGLSTPSEQTLEVLKEGHTGQSCSAHICGEKQSHCMHC